MCSGTLNMHAFQRGNEGCFAVSELHCSVGSEGQNLAALFRPKPDCQHTDLQLTPLQCQVLVLVLGYAVRRFSLIKGGHVSAAFNEAVPDTDLRLQPLRWNRLGYRTAVYTMLGKCCGPLWLMWPHILGGSCGGWLNSRTVAQCDGLGSTSLSGDSTSLSGDSNADYYSAQITCQFGFAFSCPVQMGNHQ